MPKFLVASDLDRTLIYSRLALLLTMPDKKAPRMVVSEVNEAAPLSYMTRKAEDTLVELSQKAAFVPVTTRTKAQYSRIQFPIETPEYAITTNGGVLLNRGREDMEWHRYIAAQVTENCEPIERVVEYLSKPEFSNWILRIRHAEDLFVYAITERDAVPAEFMNQLRTLGAAAGWSISLQGRKLYCVPTPVSKASAMAEVAARLGTDRTIAAGDSLLDQSMLDYADIAIRPAHGELHDAQYLGNHVWVTENRGVLAGQEILQKMLDFVSAS